ASTNEEVGAQEQAHISRALGFIESMPRQLPSITADGVRCLRSQSTPNSRPIVFDALDCSQQAVLLDERNNGTKEQVLKLEDEKSKKKTPAKPFSA
ncbi:hypothetical protein CU097_000920, partial [Rhizopus azygosporus]